MVRLRRKDEPDVLAVTGASSPLARALLARLAGTGLLAVEDATDPALQRATTVVHLGTAGEALLGLPLLSRLVLCSSAEVYGVHPDNRVPLPDGAPLRGPRDGPELAAAWEVEQLAVQARARGLAVTLLRPAALVGLDEVESPVLRQLAAPRLLAVRGIEPLWQLCHVEDLLEVLELGARAGTDGDFGVACEGALPQSDVEAMAGKRRMEVPAAFAQATAARLQRLGLAPTSVRELDHLLGPLVLECDGLRAAGWKPRWTNEEALQAHLLSLAGRSPDVRTAAYRAAGATVAVLGTAVLVRQARRRRRA